MIDEQALISRLDTANTDELSHLILNATPAEEKILRIHLGNSRFRRMRNLVLMGEMVRHERRKVPRANVVVIPGILGSAMTSVDRMQQSERIWLSPSNIVAGHLGRLRLDAYGLNEENPDFRIRATGIMKRYYGELILSLAEHYNVRAFWYDWRKDFRLAAAQLQARIDSWFPNGEPVHLVAHAAGGLVARAYIHQFPHRWDLKKPENATEWNPSKLIMIGTPNYGLYTSIQAITGHLELLQWIDLIDTHHDRADFREIIRSFPSLYQLLPTPTPSSTQEESNKLTALYKADTFPAELKVSQQHLDSAARFHALLKEAAVDPNRMLYIGGHNQPTFVDVRLDKLNDFELQAQAPSNTDRAYIHQAYTPGRNGDGTVPHPQGILQTAERKQIPAYYVEALHGDLCSHPKVLSALNQLIGTPQLADSASIPLGGLQPLTLDQITTQDDDTLRQQWEQAESNGGPSKRIHAQRSFEALVRRVNSGDSTRAVRHLTVEERDLEERLMFGFLSGDTENANKTYKSIPLDKPSIKINVVQQDITDAELEIDGAESPIDVVAFGHYSGSKPYGLMRTVDVKISKTLDIQRGLAEPSSAITDEDRNAFDNFSTLEANDADLLLTQYAQRGTIRGELAQTFFLADPRDESRLLAISGMGEPGRFGTPELTILVRELCWSLGRMGKNHLAAVLIGAGRDNLSVADAISGWIRGLKLALSGVTNPGVTDSSKVESSKVESSAVESSQQTDKIKPIRALHEVTFFVNDPRKYLAIDEAIQRERRSLEESNRMSIFYTPLTDPQKQALKDKTYAYVEKQMKRQLKESGDPSRRGEPAPTRITVSVEGNTYRFGAITEQASIPEREIPLDPALVHRANDELAAEASPSRQLELGQFMQKLMIPSDLRSQLITNAPLVMMLDSATARIHWELMAQTDLLGELGPDVSADDQSRHFLGTSRGFTRQLRTLYAQPPEPPPPMQRHLRVLVVADPAEDAHLPGAEQEGVAVANLFEQFNMLHANSGSKNRVEVVRLFGPREATRTAVLRQLVMRTYDVLHFAGHCIYDKENPARSGWIFSNGERLSAYEFTRIDRSPAFVFSNACESGITPARSDERSVDLAPSFAESFFARGVANFVCTAWPVEDRAARDFALTLYSGLLGLVPHVLEESASGQPSNDISFSKTWPLPMYEAMMKARQRIAIPPNDTRTWGAYQHYGNPYFRLFDPAGMAQDGRDNLSDRTTDPTDDLTAEPMEIPNRGRDRNADNRNDNSG